MVAHAQPGAEVRGPPMTVAPEIWTIGHWTCPVPEFLQPLHEHGIGVVVDVRAHPGSRRNPQFGSDAMAKWLPDAGIAYLHLAELGGRRRKQGADPTLNVGWKNASFRNYADYTLTEEYEAGITRLTGLASGTPTAVMCGEPMPWRCHRLLISNTLTARGWTVWHLMGESAPRRHQLGQWGAVPVVDRLQRVTYPGGLSSDG